MGRHKSVYAVYKGDEFIDLGTAEELSKKLNMTVKTIQFLATKAHHNRATSDNWMLAIRIENEK